MPPVDPVLVKIGPFAIRWYGLLIVLGSLTAAYVASIEARRRKEDPEHTWNMLIWLLIGGIIGARVYHILSTPQGASRGFAYYMQNPQDMLKIWEGGLGIYGAVAGGALALYIYTRVSGLSFWKWTDIISPGLILAQAIGRWGNFINQELYGPPTGLPWGVLIAPNYRIPPFDDLETYPPDTVFHPLFLYESIWNALSCVALLWIARKYSDRLKDGDVFSLYLVLYPVGRLVLESFRPDAWLIGGIPAAQIFAVLLIVLGVVLMVRRHRSAPTEE